PMLVVVPDPDPSMLFRSLAASPLCDIWPLPQKMNHPPAAPLLINELVSALDFASFGPQARSNGPSAHSLKMAAGDEKSAMSKILVADPSSARVKVRASLSPDDKVIVLGRLRLPTTALPSSRLASARSITFRVPAISYDSAPMSTRGPWYTRAC